jgi:hypothetical protein
MHWDRVNGDKSCRDVVSAASAAFSRHGIGMISKRQQHTRNKFRIMGPPISASGSMGDTAFKITNSL